MNKDLSEIFDIIDRVKNYPFVVAYSGGKDSSTALDLLASYALERGLSSPVYIFYNEVWLDLPPIRKWVYSHLDVVKKWADANGFNFKVLITTPPEGKDFFSLVLDKGYALPVIRWHAPWCNKEMKTRPTDRLLKSIMKENNYDTIVYITGGRIAESSKRKRSLENFGVYSPLSVVNREYVGRTYYLSPIYNWEDEEVLEFLKTHSPSVFGDSYEPLLELYSRYGEDGKKLRTGCWICPQVSRDKFLEAYARDHPEYKVVIEAREKIISISENPKYRTAVSKNGYPAGRITPEGIKEIAKVLYNLLQTVVGKELMKDYLESVPSLKEKIVKLAQE